MCIPQCVLHNESAAAVGDTPRSTRLQSLYPNAAKAFSSSAINLASGTTEFANPPSPSHCPARRCLTAYLMRIPRSYRTSLSYWLCTWKPFCSHLTQIGYHLANRLHAVGRGYIVSLLPYLPRNTTLPFID